MSRPTTPIRAQRTPLPPSPLSTTPPRVCTERGSSTIAAPSSPPSHLSRSLYTSPDRPASGTPSQHKSSPRTPTNTRGGRAYHFEVTDDPEEELVELEDVQPHRSPFHDSKAWTGPPHVERSPSKLGSRRLQEAVADRPDIEVETESAGSSRSSGSRGQAEREMELDLSKKRELAGALGLAIPIQDLVERDRINDEEASQKARNLPESTYKPPPPSFALLFSQLTVVDKCVYVAPALLLAAVSAIVTPIMTIIIGDAFGVFLLYPVDVNLATAEERSALVPAIGKFCLYLAILGCAGMALNVLMIRAWVGLAERVADRLRKRFYKSVMNRGMEWFDLGMGLKGADQTGDDAIGAGGLMAKFTKETDDVRIGNGRFFGEAVRALFTAILCVALSFWKCWSLTLVILSALPLLILIQALTERYGNPLYFAEIKYNSQLATHIERCSSAISTVKAFNAQRIETEKFSKTVRNLYRSFLMQVAVWGLSQGTTGSIVLLIFVGGFWYAAKLVTTGKATATDVVTVFWACLLASGSFSAMVPLLVYVTRGKAAMSELMGIIDGPSPAPRRAKGMFISGPLPRTSLDSFLGSAPVTPVSPLFARSDVVPVGDEPVIPLRKAMQVKAKGEINLQGVTFSYPSRPDMLVLDDVSLFLPAGEMTFIVGGSGSGKSTVTQLLLRLYDPLGGIITLDDQDLRQIDHVYAKEHIGAVQQGCVLFDMSVHDNVAMGLAGLPHTGPSDATRQGVIEACRMAMLHDFVISLPEGYETRLGTKGSTLSGGQKQRLAIARARLRDPTLLVLDECTSALDATSRVLVFDGVKRWRKNKTTIVITHDLSQIQSGDFLYLMKDGKVAEQGFRSDLIAREGSTFGQMALEQAVRPLSEDRRKRWVAGEEVEGILTRVEEAEQARRPPARFRPTSMFPGVRIESEVEEIDYLDILSDYSRRASISGSPTTNRLTRNRTPSTSHSNDTTGSPATPRRNGLHASLASPASRHLEVPLSPSPMRKRNSVARRLTWNMPLNASGGSGSIQGSLTAKRLSYLAAAQPETESKAKPPRGSLQIKVDAAFDHELRRKWSLDTVDKVEDFPPQRKFGLVELSTDAERPLRTIPSLRRQHLPGVPRKALLCTSVLLSIGHGVCIPLWAKYVASLMAGISGQPTSGPGFNTISIIVVGLSLADGIFQATAYFSMMATSANWLAKIREELFAKVLQQEQAWFDRSDNSPTRLVQRLVKDADDMRPLIAQIIARFSTVLAMMVFGIAWSLVISWKLALVGAAIAPIFAGVMFFQAKILNVLEARNKITREAISWTLYESVANIRAIRVMALEQVFGDVYEKETQAALVSGSRAGWGIALGVGLSLSLPFMTQAFLLYVIAIFMSRGVLTYESALQVFTLVLFSLQHAADMLDFVPNIAIARMATQDLDPIFKLSCDNQETRGALRFPINGDVVLDEIHFTYPTRPDVPILRGVSFQLRAGECVAIVGASGSGKSTIAGLLQRLYEPRSGSIQLSNRDLAAADVRWLRDHVAVVSQQANMFDATVAENIAYGSPNTPMEEVYTAARAANIHDFIMTLPNGYDTNLGENASLISGGQAQRLQIARALIRRSNILILDECTSALDSENQRAVLDTVMRLKSTRTTIFVTHKADVMRRCDRVLCLADGIIAEDGPYEELVRGRGVFAKLMSAGEWE